MTSVLVISSYDKIKRSQVGTLDLDRCGSWKGRGIGRSLKRARTPKLPTLSSCGYISMTIAIHTIASITLCNQLVTPTFELSR